MRVDPPLMEGHFFARLDGRCNLLPHCAAHGQLWQGGGGVALVDGVDALALRLGDGNGFDG